MKQKEYKTIVFEPDLSLTEAITRLISAAARGEFVCGKFCGVTLYSDTVSFDSAFKQIAGQSYFATLADTDEQDEEAVQRYLLMGRRIIDQSLWTDWENYVRKSVSGEYHGMELACALAIMTELENSSIQGGLSVLQTQSHNKATLSLVLSIIKTFSRYGDDFVAYVTDFYRRK